MSFSKIKNNKKGFEIPAVATSIIMTVLGLFIITVLVYAIAISGAQMATVNTAGTNNTIVGYVIGNMTSGTNSFASFAPITWIITAIVLILSVLIGGIGYLWYKKQD